MQRFKKKRILTHSKNRCSKRAKTYNENLQEGSQGGAGACEKKWAHFRFPQDWHRKVTLGHSAGPREVGSAPSLLGEKIRSGKSQPFRRRFSLLLLIKKRIVRRLYSLAQRPIFFVNFCQKPSTVREFGRFLIPSTSGWWVFGWCGLGWVGFWLGWVGSARPWVEAGLGPGSRPGCALVPGALPAAGRVPGQA